MIGARMLPRFLAESLDESASVAQLGEDETRHLSQVLRLSVGDEVAVFDGAGREFRGRVERIARAGADIHLIGEIDAAPEPAVRLTLVQAVLKGEKMDDVVRDATMMGAAAIEPVVTTYTAAHMKIGGAPKRWHRIAVASAKQCRRAVVPAIGVGTAFADWLPQDPAALRLLLVEPSASVTGHSPSTLSGDRPASASLLVGPEGGWSAAEIEAAVGAGYVPISLGGRVLRADAMPVVAIGILQFVWGDL